MTSSRYGLCPCTGWILVGYRQTCVPCPAIQSACHQLLQACDQWRWRCWASLRDLALQGIMTNIYKASAAAAKEYNTTLQGGSNIAGFLKVADAMLAQGSC